MLPLGVANGTPSQRCISKLVHHFAITAASLLPMEVQQCRTSRKQQSQAQLAQVLVEQVLLVLLQRLASLDSVLRASLRDLQPSVALSVAAWPQGWPLL